MSNMTKTIAILGVVAGLGVAALPLSTYAADVTTEWGSEADKGAAWTAGEMGGTDKTKLGEDSFVSDDTTIHLEILDKLSITTSLQDVELTVPSGSTDGLFTADPMKVTVVTKNSGGYKLTMHGSDGDNALTNAKGDKFESITAAAATLGDSQWGYKFAVLTDTVTAIADDAQWNPVATAKTDTGSVLRSSTAATSDTGESVLVQFGAQAAADQAAGVYNGKVTFTATNQAKVGA